MRVQYLIDEEGKRTAVIVPIEEWEKLQIEHEKLLNKLEVSDGLQDALKEVREIKQGSRKKGRTLDEFLNNQKGYIDMVIRNYVFKSLPLNIFLVLSFVSCSYYEDNYQMSDEQDQALTTMIDTFQTTDFLGRFGIRNDSLVYGFCKHKVKFGHSVIDTLQKYDLTGGVIHRDDLTYFINEGFFKSGNIGVLYTDESLDSLPTFKYHRLLRRSRYGVGNWYFVENEKL